MTALIQKKSQFLLKLFLSAFVLAFTQQAVAGESLSNGTQQTPANIPKIGEWSTTIANFEMIDYTIDDFEMKNSVLEALVKNSGKDVCTFLDEDKKTLRMFKLSYRVSIKLKKGKKAQEEDIVQYGLFKALNPAMQDKIDIKLSQVMPIQFKTNDPLLVVFVVKDETFNAPAMLSDKVKLFKKARNHKKHLPND